MRTNREAIVVRVVAVVASLVIQVAAARAQWVMNGSNVYFSDGNVGIGTTNPQARLEVNGPIKLGAFLGYLVGSTGHGFRFNNSLDTLNLMRIWDGGGVSIGTSYATSVDPGTNNLIVQGRVGVGTSSLQSRFTVFDNSSSIAPLTVDRSYDGSRIQFRYGGNPTTNEIGMTYYLPGRTTLWIGSNLNGTGSSHSYLQQASTAGSSWVSVHDSIYDEFFVGRIPAGQGLNRMFLINSSGNVGIGTTSPTAKLHVDGNIVATTMSMTYQDVAEWVPASRPIAAGTVVIVDSEAHNQVLPSLRAYDTRVAGVVSESPGILLGEAGDGKVKVATTGRVKVRADASGCPIEAGDLLVTSEKEGVAMKSEPIDVAGRKMHQPGTLIGKALQPLKEGEGEILVLLSLQ